MVAILKQFAVSGSVLVLAAFAQALDSSGSNALDAGHAHALPPTTPRLNEEVMHPNTTSASAKRVLPPPLPDQPAKIATRGNFVLFDPIAKDAVPSEIFPFDARLGSILPVRFMAPGLAGNTALPTNNWWGNMVAASNDAQVQPIWVNPYTLRPALSVSPFGLDIAYPYNRRVFGGSSGNGNANKYYLHAITKALTLSATEFTATPKYEVTSWDDMAVQTRFFKSDSPLAQIQATFVSGMALTTATYSQLTPQIASINSILNVNGQAVKVGQQVTDTRFVISYNSGEKWVFYADHAITFRVASATNLDATGVFNGVLRCGIVVNDAQLAVYDSTSKCIIEGGNVEALDTNSYAFYWKTRGDCSQGLVHYLQPHHIDTLNAATAEIIPNADLFSTTRGKMVAVRIKTTPPMIRFDDMMDIPMDFYPPRKPLDSSRATIKKALEDDVAANWSIPIDGSYYFNGKLAQKYAELCLIANDVAVTGTDRDRILRQCLDKLEQVLTPFVENSWTAPLHYDTAYRGIVSSMAFAKNDINVDFGNSMYNDHHYHYGYWIHTAAIVNYLDPSWTKLSQLNRVTTILIRDVANPSADDTAFPKFRQFDWFRGHSYSHGVTPFADGKDEESTSEEINFHYGVFLFGKATNNAMLQSMGKLMFKLNARAVQTYFLMLNSNTVHPPSIVPNKVTGITFDNKAEYATWFSPEKFAIHGIQMIPITPATEFVRTKQFVQEEWDQVLSKIPDVVNFNPGNAWMSLLYANYATVNKDIALQKLANVALDDGLTRSWALYMAATRP